MPCGETMCERNAFFPHFEALMKPSAYPSALRSWTSTASEDIAHLRGPLETERLRQGVEVFGLAYQPDDVAFCEGTRRVGRVEAAVFGLDACYQAMIRIP